MKASWRKRIALLLLFTVLAWIVAACGPEPTSSNVSTTNICEVAGSSPTTSTSSTPTPAATSQPITVNVGYFPNITHAAALVGFACGAFGQALAPNTISIKTFNAGGDLITALLGSSIDIGYVGPSPSINGYNNGGALRIIAGAASGGVRFIISGDSTIKSANDLHGKRIADPQAKATQDVSLRHYLDVNGLKAKDKGGDVDVVSTDNPNILTQFKAKQLDGAWVPEPWASRLIEEDGGKEFLDERNLWPDKQFVSTNIVVRTAFLKDHPDIVKAFLKAHVETVQHINANLADAKSKVNQQLTANGGVALDQKVLDDAFGDLIITYDPLAKTLFAQADNAFALGFITQKPDDGIYSLDLLNSVLTSKGLPTVAVSH
jgi:NitT/TauT family transport system substrate-binding protein